MGQPSHVGVYALTITVYLTQRRKPFLISLIPALFMTMVCVTFLFVADIAFGLPAPAGFGIGAATVVITALTFAIKFKKLRQTVDLSI